MAIRAGLSLDLSPLHRLQSTTKAKTVLLRAVKAGSKLVQAAVKAQAPRSSGTLKQSIGTKAEKGKRKIVAFAVVGARKKVRKMVRRRGRATASLAVPANYAHLVEGGTRPHGAHPGAAPQPFLAPAFAATKAQAVDAARAVLAAEVAKILAKG